MFKSIVCLAFLLISVNLLNSEESKNIIGYRGILETGYELSFKENNNRFKANVINGYQFNNFLSVGLGIGVKAFNDLDIYKFPVFIDLRTKFANREASPFFGLGLGYFFEEIYGEFENGYLIHPQMGVIIKTSTNTSLNLSLGVDMQFRKIYEWNYYVSEGKESNEYYYKNDNTAVCFNISFSY